MKEVSIDVGGTNWARLLDIFVICWTKTKKEQSLKLSDFSQGFDTQGSALEFNLFRPDLSLLEMISHDGVKGYGLLKRQGSAKFTDDI